VGWVPSVKSAKPAKVTERGKRRVNMSWFWGGEIGRKSRGG